MYVSLDNESDHSFGRSIVSPANIVKATKLCGYDAVALTDVMSIDGMVDFFKEANVQEIKPILGCKLRLYDEEQEVEKYPFLNCYVKNADGFRTLMSILTLANSDEHFYRVARVPYRRLYEDDCLNLVFASCFDESIFRFEQTKEWYRDICYHNHHNSFVIIGRERTPLHTSVNKHSLQFAEDNMIGVCASEPFRYLNKDHADDLDIMRGIIDNKGITDYWFKRRPLRDEVPIKAEDFFAHFKKQNLKNQQIAMQTSYTWEDQPISLPKIVEDEDAEIDYLIQIGWQERLTCPISGYQPTEDDLENIYKPRLEYELGILKEMGFVRYFLMVSDLTSWCHSNGITLGVGRGSAAGSLVSYLLGITGVDPIRFGLIFERFINPSRNDLPDIDLDCMSTRRHEAYAYLEGKYGKDNVAAITNYVRQKPAGTLRSVGRMCGLEPIEMVCTKAIDNVNDHTLDQAAERIGELVRFKEKHPDIYSTASVLTDKMRNFGVHAAGIVITDDSDGNRIADRAVVYTRGDNPTVNWDKQTVEHQGLVKIDWLGLSTLDLIAFTLESIDEDIDLMQIPLDDKKTLNAFGQGKTAGVFQFEGSGVRRVLKDLASAGDLVFEDLAITTALYRPGPMESGLLDSYVKRRQGYEHVFYDHPAMEDALRDTLGIMIYQENVAQISVDIAGYTMSEADTLRKVMGKKLPAEMAKQKGKFVSGCGSKSGMPESEAEKLFDKIEKFAGYGFNKSHAISYATISYWSMYLKVNYPSQFYAAALSIAKDDTKKRTIVNAALNDGIKVLIPDVNVSTHKFEVLSDGNIIMPLSAIKGMGDKAVDAVLTARHNVGGKFTSEEQFLDSVDKRRFNSARQRDCKAVGATISIDPMALPAEDESRLKDQLELLPGLITRAVKADRLIDMRGNAGFFERLCDGIRNCDQCDLHDKPHVVPRPGSNPYIMVITDGPDGREESDGVLMPNGAKAAMTQAMDGAGISMDDVYFTSMMRAKKEGGFYATNQLSKCSDFLAKEIEVLKPPVILAMGSNAVRYFLPGTKGPVIELNGQMHYLKEIDATVICGISPGMVYFDPDKQNDVDHVFDLAKSLEYK